MSALDLVNQIVSPTDVRAILRQTPSYVKTRERTAALVHDGLAAYDQYQIAKPYIFWASVLGALGSGYGYYKRRGAGAEAKILYGTGFVVCSAIAFLTRPAFGAEAKAAEATDRAAAATGQSDIKGGSALMGWLDKRVQTLKDQDPDFADTAITRAINIPGFKEQFQGLPPLIRAAVI